VSQIWLNGRFRAQSLTGVQRFAEEISAGLARRCAVRSLAAPTLLTPSGAPPGDPLLPSLPVGRRQGVLWEQWELPQHARGGVLVNLGNTAPLRAGRQLVVIHDAGVFATPESYSWQFRRWYKLLHGLLARSPARIVSVSRFSRSEVARHLGIDEACIGLVSEGAEHITAVAPDETILDRHGLRAGAYVLVVGSLAAHKNLDALGAMAEMLANRGVTLVITGGINAAVFKSAPSRLPMPANYVGRVSDSELRALYGNAVCFVFASRYEGFGLPAVEAMACGCPVVAAAIPSLMEICGDAALYCNPRDPADIAATVAQLLDQPALAERIRRNGKARAASYSWDKAADMLLDEVERMNVSMRSSA
jgi:glycosyltransferase involved in cell wall biosynthesis